MDKIKLTIPCEECLLRAVCLTKYKIEYSKNDIAFIDLVGIMPQIIKCIESCENLKQYFKSISKDKLNKINLYSIKTNREYIYLWNLKNNWTSYNTFIHSMRFSYIIYDIPLIYFNELNNLIIKSPIQLDKIKNYKQPSYLLKDKFFYKTTGFFLSYINKDEIELTYYSMTSKEEQYENLYDFLQKGNM